MATEKILIFDEAGNAKRMKVRIARFLDNEPVTASDKENIRTTLDVDDSLSGTFTTPLSVTSASDSSFTGGGNVGIGTSSPDSTLEVTGASATSNNGATVLVTDNASVAADIGGTIALRGTDGSTDRTLALIKGGKVDATSAFDGYLSLQTRSNGASNTTEAIRIDHDQRVGIGSSSPGSYNSGANHLVVGSESGNKGATIVSGTASTGYLFFADGTGANAYRGRVAYNHASDQLYLGAGGATNWKIDGSTGNLIAVSAGASIDFGSTNTNTGVTVTGSVMSEYEQGTFTPKLADAASGGNEASIGTVGADYIRVGNQVFFAIRLLNINTTGLTSGNAIHITDMPYACKSNSSFVPFNVMADTLTFGGQLVGALQGGVSYATLRQFSSGAGDSAVPVSAIGSTATDLFFSGSYFVD